MKRLALALIPAALCAAPVHLPGLNAQVEILRDRWGVPHIYAANAHDLFFAQGYLTAVDRLFQIDLWRRTGTGKLAEIAGPAAAARDVLARSVNFHGDWNAEWAAYGPDARAITTAFTDGINAYIKGLKGRWPREFQIAGYAPDPWTPEDCLSRVAGLTMTRNLTNEVQHALDIQRMGIDRARQTIRLEPAVPLEVPEGLDLSAITTDILRAYRETVGPVRLTTEQGSNNWVVDGTMTKTGRPMLANDPHRPVQLPSLRKTVHLVAPGWDAIGAGEPALPGIALGHNQTIAFGFTIVGIDQQDLYVETVNPENPGEYRYRGAWKKFETETQRLKVKGEPERTVTLRRTVHGPVIYDDAARRLAYVLRWVGGEPGTAGYMAGISLARAKNWTEFRAAMARYKVPSENLVYADTSGNIGWQVGGMTPIREGWNGLLPVPGAEGKYEWTGFQKSDALPFEFNPARHWIATANHNILPPGYAIPLGYDGWASPNRVNRIREMLGAGGKFDIEDFVRMQQDVVSIPAREWAAKLLPVEDDLHKWNGELRADSRAALIYEVWQTMRGASWAEVEAEIERRLGKDQTNWQWGKVHTLTLVHPLGRKEWQLGPVGRPGDANTVNATSGANFRQTNGASWREILDVGDWDRSVMTNVPGESGDPSSKYYSDLLEDWAAGKYHPMPFSRKAVEAAEEERIILLP
jgi:penicillin amidase